MIRTKKISCICHASYIQTRWGLASSRQWRLRFVFCVLFVIGLREIDMIMLIHERKEKKKPNKVHFGKQPTSFLFPIINVYQFTLYPFCLRMGHLILCFVMLYPKKINRQSFVEASAFWWKQNKWIVKWKHTQNMKWMFLWLCLLKRHTRVQFQFVFISFHAWRSTQDYTNG